MSDPDDLLGLANDYYLSSQAEIAALKAENEALRKELARVMQAAVNGGYCRRDHK